MDGRNTHGEEFRGFVGSSGHVAFGDLAQGLKVQVKLHVKDNCTILESSLPFEHIEICLFKRKKKCVNLSYLVPILG